MQQQIEREIDEMERHKRVETRMERKRDKKGKPQVRQTRVLESVKGKEMLTLKAIKVKALRQYRRLLVRKGSNAKER